MKKSADIEKQLRRVDKLLKIIDKQDEEIEELKNQISILNAEIRRQKILLGCYRRK